LIAIFATMVNRTKEKQAVEPPKSAKGSKNQPITAPGDITQQVRLMNNLSPMYRFESLGFPIDT